MKTNLSKQLKRGLTLLFIFLTIMFGIYAQKSFIHYSETLNLNGLKVIVTEIKNSESIVSDRSLKPIEIKVELNDAYKLNIEHPEFTDFDMDAVADEEEALKIEDWMLDENHFKTDYLIGLLDDAAEEKPAVEEWMLDESHFLNKGMNQKDGSYEKEESLKVEDWMLDESHFSGKSNKFNRVEKEGENEMIIETWMLNPGNWSSVNN